MADTKISALPAAGSVAGANELAINEAGTSKKVTATQLRTFSLGTLDELTDVTITAPADGDRVAYNGSAWVNRGLGGSLPTAVGSIGTSGTSVWPAHEDHVHPMLYAPGSFTVESGSGRIAVKQVQLTTTQRATLQGTARLVII